MHDAFHSPPSTARGSGGERTFLRRGTAALAAILLFAAFAEARAQQSPLGVSPRTAASRGRDDGSHQSSAREEMLKRVEIKRREEAYKENIEWAKESAALGAELCRVFERYKGLGPAEQKKLGRMEKLARSIRERAGGDDDNKERLKEMPPGLEASFDQLQKLSSELQDKVEKTPRHVISTSVINTANELLDLIRHLRAFFK